MSRAAAFIFDMNGTMIDDMEFHNIAWYDILNEELKAGLTRQQVKKEMYGKNAEVLDRIFGKGKFTTAEVDAISMKKEKNYQQAFLPHLKLIDGLDSFLARAEKEHIAMAIGTAAIPFNVDFVLDNLSIRHYFKSIVTADDVLISKPHPETFLKAAAALGVAPSACVVFEDAPKGVEAAYNAGMGCIVLTTMHEKSEFPQLPNILGFCRDYNDPLLEMLFGK